MAENNLQKDLARYLNLPRRVIDKPPSPDLLPGIVDEAALRITYQELDQILYALNKGYSEDEITVRLKIAPEVVKRIKQFVTLSNRLRKPVPYPGYQND
ncbi:MAG: hypothetical protein R6U91_06780 [Bacillota bacterium]